MNLPLWRRRKLMPSLVAAAALAAAAATSCAAKAVTGFPWRDASGRSLAFSQASSWPEGSEGRFEGEKPANRYTLRKRLGLEAGQAIQVTVARRGPRGGASGKLNLSLSAKADGTSPSVVSTFALIGDTAELVLAPDGAVSVESLSVSASGGSPPFELQSVDIVPSFRGIEAERGSVRMSSGLTMARGEDYVELSIPRPFAGLDGPKADRKAAAGGDRLPGVVLQYGEAAKGASFRVEAWLADGTKRSFKLRSHPSGVKTVLDESIVPADTELLILHGPVGAELSSFYSGRLSPEDYCLADLGRVLVAEPPEGDFSFYRWDMLPSVLVFDFKDYGTQDKYLKRLAFFVEKAGYRGTLMSDAAIASLHGWNAHDYRAEDLASFFQTARAKSFPLNDEERRLEGILLDSGTLRLDGDKIAAGVGAVISVTRESSGYLRWTFAVHESTHGIFFADPDYRDFVTKLWASVGREEKWFWRAYFTWAMYDTSSDYLMGNEFQAYLLQQPKAMAEEYFSVRKAGELLEKHEELRPKVEDYMAKYSKSFEGRAGQLEAWLFAKYGVTAGRTVFLTPAR